MARAAALPHERLLFDVWCYRAPSECRERSSEDYARCASRRPVTHEFEPRLHGPGLYRLCASAQTAGGPKTESAGHRKAVTGVQASGHPNASEVSGADFVGSGESSQLRREVQRRSGFLSVSPKREHFA